MWMEVGGAWWRWVHSLAILMGNRVYLTVHPPPPSSIHLHPAPSNTYGLPCVLNRAPTSTQLHPPPPSSTQLHQLLFGQIWVEKVKNVFYLKISTHGILRMLIFIPTLIFRIFKTKSIFRQIWVEKFKVVCFATNLHTEYLEKADFYSDSSFLNF